MRSLVLSTARPVAAVLATLLAAPPAFARTVRCESRDFCYRYCPVQTYGDVTLRGEWSKGSAAAAGVVLGAAVAAAILASRNKHRQDDRDVVPSWLVGRFEGYNTEAHADVAQAPETEGPALRGTATTALPTLPAPTSTLDVVRRRGVLRVGVSTFVPGVVNARDGKPIGSSRSTSRSSWARTSV